MNESAARPDLASAVLTVRCEAGRNRQHECAARMHRGGGRQGLVRQRGAPHENRAKAIAGCRRHAGQGGQHRLRRDAHRAELHQRRVCMGSVVGCGDCAGLAPKVQAAQGRPAIHPCPHQCVGRRADLTGRVTAWGVLLMKMPYGPMDSGECSYRISSDYGRGNAGDGQARGPWRAAFRSGGASPARFR